MKLRQGRHLWLLGVYELAFNVMSTFQTPLIISMFTLYYHIKEHLLPRLLN